MRARVAVASNALSCDDLSLAAANLTHCVLLDEINAHANLVFGDNADLAAFLHAVRSEASLPQGAKTRWTETLVRLKKQGRIRVTDDHAMPLATVSELPELRVAWAKHAEVAVIANSACPTLHVPDTGLRIDPGAKPDVATATAATQAPDLRRIQDLEAEPFVANGTPREGFWRDVLAPVASGATSATVLDRYLFQSALDLAAGQPWTRGWRGEQLGWLLKHLDDVMAPGAEVRLVGQSPTRYGALDADETAEAVYDAWQPSPSGRLAAVELVLAPATSGSAFPHDRHIRFSSGAAVGITAGFDRLRAEAILDDDGMAWSYWWHPNTLQALEVKEARAASLANTPPALVLRR